MTDLIRAMLRPGDIFVDIGAHLGYFTLLASKLVGPQGRVFAFEPSAGTRAQLSRHLEMNGAQNVDLRVEAVSDTNGEVKFHPVTSGNLGLSSIRSVHESKETVTVPSARLDDLLGTQRTISLIKIDVEGAEQLALNGMPTILSQQRPDLIIEVTDRFLRQLGSTAEAMYAHLSGLGYRMYAIRANCNELIPVEKEGLAALPWQYNAWFTTRPNVPAGFALRERW